MDELQMRATPVPARLTGEAMTEASLLTEECCNSHQGGVVSVTAAAQQQSDQVWTLDPTAQQPPSHSQVSHVQSVWYQAGMNMCMNVGF